MSIELVDFNFILIKNKSKDKDLTRGDISTLEKQNKVGSEICAKCWVDKHSARLV